MSDCFLGDIKVKILIIIKEWVYKLNLTFINFRYKDKKSTN